MLISVCMCTYKRPQLSYTLNSIANLIVPKGCRIEIIVVDNDAARTGEAICNGFRKQSSLPLVYTCEPKKNIAAARNALLDHATGQWLAFIDDDEVAEANWLNQLFTAAATYSAQVVFGRVVPVYPSDAPRWIREGGYFRRRQKQSGSEVSSGACNSTLVLCEAYKKHNIRFDEKYGLSGGEDADFFYRLHRCGLKMIVCQEAVVNEPVEPQRMNAAYLIKRHKRIGLTFNQYRLPHASLVVKSRAFVTTLLKLLFSLFALAFCLPLGKKIYFRHLLNFYDALGKLSYFTRTKAIEMY